MTIKPDTFFGLARVLLASPLFTVIALSYSVIVYAQENSLPELGEDRSATLEEQIPSAAILHKRKQFVTLTVENDLFGSGNDQDYTSGVRLTYFRYGKEPQRLADFVDHLIPTFDINDTTSVSYSIGHNLYTPSDITVAEPQPNDRPWAAFLYGSMGLSSVSGNHIDDAELMLGIVGPSAQGENVQTTVHKLIGSPTPKGWKYQLEDEPGLGLSWRRRWPQLLSYEFNNLSLSVEPSVGATVGNIYTMAETGIMARLTPTSGRWQDTPLLVRPAMPGTGFFQSQDGVGWYLFGGLQGRVVARNIFLDGNTFKDSHSVDKRHWVWDANAGIAFTYHHVRLSYTAVYRSKEYRGQEDPAVFGAIGLSYRF